jgi:hypothetical protein
LLPKLTMPAEQPQPGGQQTAQASPESPGTIEFNYSADARSSVGNTRNIPRRCRLGQPTRYESVMSVLGNGAISVAGRAMKQDPLLTFSGDRV